MVRERQRPRVDRAHAAVGGEPADHVLGRLVAGADQEVELLAGD